MVFGIIGENCSGKSTLAERIKETLGGEIITGKDYLRMAKSESEAVSLFREKLSRAVSGDNIIYVIADQEHVNLLPDGAVRILVTADLETIKERFRARMHGNLPAPVALMLERKHGLFDSGEYDYRFDGAKGDAESFCEILKCDKRDSARPFTIRRLSEDEPRWIWRGSCSRNMNPLITLRREQRSSGSAFTMKNTCMACSITALLMEISWSGRSPSGRTENISAFSLWMADIIGAESARECFSVCLKIILERRSP